ncbi:hypothetical protein [uncultured Clostridium sp.]|uniref:hypothetical protein n=1 Tax=uncultured Clostridium sp. TaxID=59620 RepID=UPI0028E6FB86|nr:hypothetical protein [uncultured Clostridium sp.]
MNKALEILIESINAQLAILNANDFKIHDEENPEWIIKEIYYNQDDDNLYFKCQEDK